VATTTREPARRPSDFARRIDGDMLAAVLASRADLRDLACFVCGATGFVETAASALVRLGVPAEAVKTERYGGA
jgi:ferredoxin-NADP reductase